jgi:hypothetical protein
MVYYIDLFVVIFWEILLFYAAMAGHRSFVHCDSGFALGPASAERLLGTSL